MMESPHVVTEAQIGVQPIAGPFGLGLHAAVRCVPAVRHLPQSGGACRGPLRTLWLQHIQARHQLLQPSGCAQAKDNYPMPLLPHRFHTSVEFRSAMPYPRMMKMGLGEALKYGRGPCTHAWNETLLAAPLFFHVWGPCTQARKTAVHVAIISHKIRACPGCEPIQAGNQTLPPISARPQGRNFAYRL